MKKIVFLVMLALLSQLAEAKTILYVTNASTYTACSSLQAVDSLYCNRLTNLGYTVNVIDELHARDNSTTWNQYVNNSDMIFLGSDSLDMAKNVSRSNFCGNITSTGKPLFFTSVNTWVSKPNVLGCAFIDNLVNFSFSDNKCSTKSFKIAKTGFITEGYNLNGNITIYALPKTAKIYDVSNGGWMTAECIPPNGSIDFYPVLFTNNNDVFWGLDEPSSFSNATWDIFDRTVLNLLNDSSWTVEAFNLPSISTVNQTTLIFARITQNGKPVTGIVNYTIGNFVGNMSYDNMWKSSINFSQKGTYNLNITAYSSLLRGSTILPITIGDLIVNINSGDFKPGSSYTVSAEIDGVDHASYRVLNASNYQMFSGGSLTCENDICTGGTSAMPDTNSLLLEVTASGNSAGGSLKIINRGTLTTDKNIYKPGDVMVIDYFPNKTVSQANLTIIRPDGTKETPSPLQMDLISENHWNKNYNLGRDCLNGTWIINLKTKDNEYNKSVNVIAWEPFAYMNKKSFDVFEKLFLTFGTSEAYSNNLNISVSAEIIRPDNITVHLGSVVIKGNEFRNFSYSIPKGYPSGLSTIKISFEDSSNRSSELDLNFSTNITLLGPSLFVVPSIISLTTIEGKTIEENFTLENTAQVKAPSIITNFSGPGISVQAPSSLEVKSSGKGKVIINTAGLGEGNYSGSVNFYSLVGDTDISIDLEIVGDLSSQASEKYSELSQIEGNITYLGKSLVNTTNASELLNETKDALNETVNYYNSGEYELAKAKFEEASNKFTDLESEVNNLYTKLPDYSFIVWYFALAIIVTIVVITLYKLMKRRKKAKKTIEKEAPPKEPSKEEVYFEPKGGEYRTEYY